MAEPRNAITMSGFQQGAKATVRRSDIYFALGVVGIISVLLLPMPAFMLDFLLGCSITLSVLILMTVMFVERGLNLNSFPTILLLATLLRLALNVASMRLILSEGNKGTAAAGHVIEAFGKVVTAGSPLIGFIVFCILTIINFVVITKGSGRIAEVSARFSLDAMPGKQMAIDADLSAGLINEDAAKVRRKELEDESNFFGAMDGASKFVRGDAVAGLMITAINFIAGIILGVAIQDLDFKTSLNTYTLLSIGDGLVSQVPALIVSTAAGLLVTKSGNVGSADKAVLGQLTRYPEALAVTSALIALLGIFGPGFPPVPFLVLSGIIGFVAWTAYGQKKMLAASGGDQPAGTGGKALGKIAAGPGQTAADGSAAPAEESVSASLHIDSLRLELGYGLLPLINYQKGHRLTEQIKALRKQIAKELGYIMPPVRIQDNMQLPANTYVLKVKEMECARGDVRPTMLLVMDPAGNKIALPGEETIEPTFGLPAMWITESHREEAMFRGLTVVDPPTVITTHLTEVLKENIAELLSYAETQKLLDELDKDHQKLIVETIPSQITITGVQRVLQNLLAEMISIRDLSTILEAIAEGSRITQNLTMITEHVRGRLARQISYAASNEEGVIPIVALSPQWEQTFVESLSGNGEEKTLSMAPSKIQDFIMSVRGKFDQLTMQGEVPVLLTSPTIRPYVRSIVERFRPNTIIMSQNEIHTKARIKTLGQI